MDYTQESDSKKNLQINREKVYIEIIRKLVVLDRNTLQPIDSKINGLKWYFFESIRGDLIIFLVNLEKVDEMIIVKLTQ